MPMGALVKHPDFHPSIEVLTNLTINEMHLLHIKEVAYDTFSETIIKLQFGFSKGQSVWKKSPPPGTYPVEPRKKAEID